MTELSRSAYAEMFGPTTGDRVRLADTDLWVQVEDDRTLYGEEIKFGGGKVIRDGMGQCQLTSDDVVDLIITNALIIDHWGIVKADIGIKDGKIAAIGKGGNPDIQPGVTIPVGRNRLMKHYLLVSRRCSAAEPVRQQGPTPQPVHPGRGTSIECWKPPIRSQ